jgi:hypothetical protein
MYDSVTVCVVQRFRYFERMAQRLVDRKTTPRNSLCEALSFDVLEDEVGDPIGFADVVQSANMRVIQTRGRTGFPLESPESVPMGFEAGRQDLDGDRAAEAQVSPAIDLAHSARAQRRKDLVRAQTRADRERHGRRNAFPTEILGRSGVKRNRTIFFRSL